MSGQFLNNEASDRGGVLFAADDSTVILVDGVFEGNDAYDGGVAYVGEDAIFVVESGTFASNTADNSGGAFAVSEGGNIQVGITRHISRYGWCCFGRTFNRRQFCMVCLRSAFYIVVGMF